MAPKITTSASIRSCYEYDLRSKNADDPPGEWVAGSVIGSARAMSKSTAFYRHLRPDCKKAIWSCSLSLPPADGRREAAEWGQIAESFLQKMGVDIKTHAWAAHRHQHDNDHIHIRLCRISSAGTLWNQEHSAKRAIKVCAELEAEFNLETHDRTPAKKKRPTMAEEQILSEKVFQCPAQASKRQLIQLLQRTPRASILPSCKPSWQPAKSTYSPMPQAAC